MYLPMPPSWLEVSVTFLYANNKLTDREMKKTISFTIASKRIKYLGTNLAKDVEDMYSENYKTLKKETKEDTSGSTYVFMGRKN